MPEQSIIYDTPWEQASKKASTDTQTFFKLKEGNYNA